MAFFNLMPICRSFLRVRFWWLLRAVAWRCCQCWIVLAVCSMSLVDARPLSHQLRTNEPVAVWTWHTVNSGFFPPQLFADSSQEQVTHAGENQVSLEPQPPAAFPLVEPDLLFLISKTSLHAPTRESDQQHGRDICLGRCVAHEEFDFIGIQYVACDNQMQFDARQAFFVFDRDASSFHFPDNGTFLAILNTIPQPGLISQCGRMLQQVFDAACLGASRDNAGRFSTASTRATKWSVGHTRRMNPASECHRHFANERLAAVVQALQKQRFSSIALVEAQPVKRDAVFARTIVNRQGNLSLGPIDHIIGDTGCPATLAVFRPAFGKKQVAIDEAMKVAGCVTQMHRDQTVLFLADLTALGFPPLTNPQSVYDRRDSSYVGTLSSLERFRW